jgi:cysteine desulfurase
MIFIDGCQGENYRVGRENLPGIIGLGGACKLAGRDLEKANPAVKDRRGNLENARLAKT